MREEGGIFILELVFAFLQDEKGMGFPHHNNNGKSFFEWSLDDKADEEMYR